MKEKIDALKETFLLLPEWADRYNYLVELGESLPAMPWHFKYRRTGLLAILCCISTCVISKTFAIYLLLPMLLYLPG